MSHPVGVWECDALVSELLGSLVVPLCHLSKGIDDEVQQFGIRVLITGIPHVNRLVVPAKIANYLAFTPLIECVKQSSLTALLAAALLGHQLLS